MYEVSFMDAFRHSPLPYILMTLIALLGIVVGLVGAAVAFKSKKLGIAGGAFALVLGILGAVVGVGGWMYGRSQVEAAVSSPGLKPSDRAMIREFGNAEASYTLYYGLGTAAPVLLLGVVALGVGITRKSA